MFIPQCYATPPTMARLLIVEDNHELASLITSYASTRGYTPLTFHTGKGALQAIQAEPCVAAIVDLLLPDMRGGEILDKLREQRIPAIAVSGVYKGSRFSAEVTGVHGAAAFFSLGGGITSSSSELMRNQSWLSSSEPGLIAWES